MAQGEGPEFNQYQYRKKRKRKKKKQDPTQTPVPPNKKAFVSFYLQSTPLSFISSTILSSDEILNSNCRYSENSHNVGKK
jgi:hypothetical protein